MLNDGSLVTDDLSQVRTKRVVLAQVAICQGCCCGNISRGKPEVPVNWLKQEWRSRGMTKVIQLTISGCLGPCDLVNVVRISGDSVDIWLGGLESQDDYVQLANWAEQCVAKDDFVPLPEHLQAMRFHPFSKG